MVYDRRHEDGELHFEASGALRGAALILRDRETDSWWSMMESRAIGGPLDGMEISELPVAEKITWSAWRQRHPESLVLSVEGSEHLSDSPYEDYFGSAETFRNVAIDDARLEPKAPIFGGWIDDRPHAVPHAAFGGGAILPLDDDRSLLLYRPADAPIFASSRVYLIATTAGSATSLLEQIDAGTLEAEPVSGFDTYWYTWALANGDTAVLR